MFQAIIALLSGLLMSVQPTEAAPPAQSVAAPEPLQLAALDLTPAPHFAPEDAHVHPTFTESGESSASYEDFQRWVALPANASRVAAFEAALKAEGLYGVVPTYQLLRTALDWKKCRAEPFELPEESMWPGALASLRTLRDDIIPVVGDVEIVSGYRDAALNSCAGGASRSVHRQFGAFDGYALAEVSREQMIADLCDWHGVRGGPLSAGLGIYRGKKFHIDGGLRGNRRWGSDYSSGSSPCNGRPHTTVATAAR